MGSNTSRLFYADLAVGLFNIDRTAPYESQIENPLTNNSVISLKPVKSSTYCTNTTTAIVKQAYCQIHDVILLVLK